MSSQTTLDYPLYLVDHRHRCCSSSISYHQLSRLRKSATLAGLSHTSCTDGFDSWTDALRSVVPLHTPDRHLICRWWCGPCNCSKADSDQNAAGQEWYGLTEVADFQEVRYRPRCLLYRKVNFVLIFLSVDRGGHDSWELMEVPRGSTVT